MLDLTIAAMASTILAPYIAKGGEAFASEFGKTVGQKIGELSDLVKNRFKGDKEAETVLDLVEKNPQSKARVASLEEEIGKKMKEDPDFAKKLSALLEQFQETESGKILIKADNRSVAAQNIIGGTITIGDRLSSDSKGD
jgi:hypothetical protein